MRAQCAVDQRVLNAYGKHRQENTGSQGVLWRTLCRTRLGDESPSAISPPLDFLGLERG